MSMRTWLRAAVVPLVLGATAVVASPAPASAANNVGTFPFVESRCNSSLHLLCLYYNSGMDTAWWGTSTSVRDLAGRTFSDGRPVKNDAAAISCDAATSSICYVFPRSGYVGEADFTYGQRSGVLELTKNNNASVRLSLG